MGKIFVIAPIVQKKGKILPKIVLTKILPIEESTAITNFWFRPTLK